MMLPLYSTSAPPTRVAGNLGRPATDGRAGPSLGSAGRGRARFPPVAAAVFNTPGDEAARSRDGRPEAHSHDPRRELTEAERAARPAASDRTRSPLRPPRVRGRRS